MWPFKRSSSSLMALDAATKELVQARAARMAAQERFLAAVKNLEAGKTITINGADHGEETQEGRSQGWQARRIAQSD
jgi:hypothetical protein